MPPSTSASWYKEMASRLLQRDTKDGFQPECNGPKVGGLARKDGVQVKWELTRPKTALGTTSLIDRTDLPFFTHDVTARNIRIPFDDPEKTSHPWGAIGISTIETLYPKALYGTEIEQYTSILGVPAECQRRRRRF